MMLAQEESAEDPQIHVLEIAGNSLIGGMEKYVFNLAQHLPTNQFKVTCLAPFESTFTASIRNLGCDVFIVPMDNDPHWRSIQFVTEYIRHQNVNIIHTHLPRAHVLGGICGSLMKIPVVATVHGMDITAQDLGISRTTETHLTVVCQDAYAQALALGLPPDRVTLIPNGVDTKTFSTHRSGAAFRKALRIPVTSPLVGFVGRLAWEKGPDQFIQTAQYVHDRFPDVYFVLVGEGPMEADLQELICDSKMNDYIQLAGLWLNTWDVYPALDILAQTSRVEGMPFALLEGMACGRPVAAMSVGGVAEIIEVGTTGVTSAGGDWAGLGEGIIKLLKNPEMCKLMGQTARKRVEENFELQMTIRAISSLFKKLLGKKVPSNYSMASAWSPAGREREVLPIETGSIFPKTQPLK